MPKLNPLPSQPELPLLEEQILEFWTQNQIFQKSVEQRSKANQYIFYDGPPFATGMPHYGHLLASTIKDVIPRFQTMRGKRVERVWGWDCHGIPIENMIEKMLDIKGGKKGIEALGIDKFNQACRSEVLRLDKAWETIIGRLGRWVDFSHSYKTMDKSFMESVWWGFSELYKKGLVYEGRKVIMYCPRCSTPLSNFEIAMDNSYQTVTEPGTTYKYKVVGQEKTYFLAWSTTPWNKLATPALAVHPDLEYVQVQQGDEKFVLVASRLNILKDQSYSILNKYKGTELTAWKFEPHYDFFLERTSDEQIGVVVADPFVTADEGTGIVTLAVYGEEDYKVMKQLHIQLVEHVDLEGKIKPEVTPWAGKFILSANPLINQDLDERGLIYRDDPHQHSVAVCYRCSTRLYYAPVPAWFIDVAQLRPELIAQNEKINWHPAHLKHGRFLKGLENAPDWNISRSRYWGTPMPIWRGADANGNQLIRIVSSVAELQKWALDPQKVSQMTDIHREFLDEIQVWVDEQKTVVGTRVPEVFDCWIESGSMPFASQGYPFKSKQQFEENYPAQFVSEYIAQTRAWFYTMHVISVGIFGKQPFEHVLTTGTILAEDGSKMSKSKKNYPDPMILINTYGVDSLRLYLMSSTVMKSENQNFSEKEVADLRRKVFVVWWNVLSFYLNFGDQTQMLRLMSQGNLSTEKTAETLIGLDVSQLHILDQWLLSRIQTLNSKVTEYMESYDVIRASRLLIKFAGELSTWYLRLSRDRVKDKKNDTTNLIFGYALISMAQLFAPICPFFSEQVFHQLVSETDSIHLTDWPDLQAKFVNEELDQAMESVMGLVESGHAVRKLLGVKVRQPLASVTFYTPEKLSLTEPLIKLIKQELNVEQVNWEVKSEETEPIFDTQITPELQAKGEAREVIRTIQQWRKKAGLMPDQRVKAGLTSWPAEYQTEIEQKTNSELILAASPGLLAA